MNHFYLDSDFTEQTVTLPPSEMKHVRVLKIEKGEKVILVNGREQIAEAIKKEESTFEILHVKSKKERAPFITLALALTKQSKLELVIEKGVELGIHHFLLFTGQKSEKNDLKPKQLERLRLIAISAMKQCQRSFLPKIDFFKDLFTLSLPQNSLYYGDLSSNAKSLKPIKEEATIFIGPEKGFHLSEIQFFKKHHALGVQLGRHTLRAETAAIAASSLFCSRNIL